ncbi:unnamed protein product [Rotaria magnacalcarata]|uniref:DDE Tnp4 domain-containing protein n=1 Tax=Rotaria magnacalcarata TaxID=392030 RepID=A0A814YJ97_9BILA|nr:unnamed protein product [Rotaria magnacalcarata]
MQNDFDHLDVPVFRCEGQINHDDRKYWAGGSLILRVFLAVNSERRVNPDDSSWGACRRRYDRWRKAMQNDFDHLDVPVDRTDSQENEESMLMEVDTDIVTENEGIEMYKGNLSYEARQSVKQSKDDDIILNKHNVEKLIDNFRLALKHAGSLDFDDPGALENETYKTITGLDRDHFNDLLDKLTTMRNFRLRSVLVALAIFLAKIRRALSNRVIACVFRLASKRSVSRICHQVRVALMQDFVPYHVGFQHASRETILAQHQTTVATELLTNGRDQVVLITDGTYFFCQKSSNNEFQRRTYSQHKHRHLVKPMIITASFHDTANTLNRLGLQVAMPGFLHNKKQHPTDEANRTRFVTKNRWVIESVNGKIKQWKFMTQIIQNSTIRFISDYLDIICALINKYQFPAVIDIENGREIAMNMREMLTTENRLQTRLAKHTGTTSLHWSKHKAANFQFPPLTEENIRDLTFRNIKLIAIIVVYIPVSTTCYDDSTKDYSRRAASKVVLDNQTHFRETVLKLCNELRPNLILKTGGTGINSDDITPEVTS